MNSPSTTTERAETATQEESTASRDVALIAHRGFAGVYPENTVAAVERAAARSTARESAARSAAESTGRGSPEMVEVDVMPTADGEVVCFHDAELGRVTDAPADLVGRPVWEVPYDRLARLDVLGTGQRVPRLRDVLEAVPADVGVNVEFKNPGADAARPDENLPPAARADQRDLWRGFAADVLGVLDDFDHDVLVSSFAEGALAAVRELDPGVPLAVAFTGSVADGLAVARRYDCEAVHPPLNAVAGTSLFGSEYDGIDPFEDRGLVATAHEEGRAVNAWTVENWCQADQLRRAGVDGVIADYPGVLGFDGASAETGETAESVEATEPAEPAP